MAQHHPQLGVCWADEGSAVATDRVRRGGLHLAVLGRADPAMTCPGAEPGAGLVGADLRARRCCGRTCRRRALTACASSAGTARRSVPTPLPGTTAIQPVVKRRIIDAVAQALAYAGKMASTSGVSFPVGRAHMAWGHPPRPSSSPARCDAHDHRFTWHNDGSVRQQQAPGQPARGQSSTGTAAAADRKSRPRCPDHEAVRQG